MSKAQISKIIQSGGFLGKLLGPLLKTVIKPLGLLGLTEASSAIDAGVQKKIYGSGSATTLIVSNDDIQDIFKKVKSLEDSGVLLKGVTETTDNDMSKKVVFYQCFWAH